MLFAAMGKKIDFFRRSPSTCKVRGRAFLSGVSALAKDGPDSHSALAGKAGNDIGFGMGNQELDKRQEVKSKEVIEYPIAALVAQGNAEQPARS